MDILSTIVEYKKTVIASAKKNIAQGDMHIGGKTRGFAKAISEKHFQNKKNIIAEIKKGSPSKGLIVSELDVSKTAAEYELGGATCISVLTDEKFFFGKNENLQLAKSSTTIPILRKDFIIDQYQIYESKHIGADAILLITSILEGNQMAEFESLAFSLGLDVLVEIHDEFELEKAQKFTKSPLIGVNNRNLRNFEINFENTTTLMKGFETGRIPVCESGIENYDDMHRVHSKGCNCFLVGTAIMKSENKAEFIRDLIK